VVASLGIKSGLDSVGPEMTPGANPGSPHDPLDDDAVLEKAWDRSNADPVFQPAHSDNDLASFGIARDPSTMTPQERADYATHAYESNNMGIYETTGRLARGLAGEKAAAEFLASEGHQILYYKPDIAGTNQGGFDLVTMQGGKVYLVDNKAYRREGNLYSASALTTNLEQNLASIKADLGKMANDATRTEEERDIAQRALDLIETGNYQRLVTNASLSNIDNAGLSGVSDQLKGIKFLDLMRIPKEEERQQETQQEHQDEQNFYQDEQQEKDDQNSNQDEQQEKLDRDEMPEVQRQEDQLQGQQQDSQYQEDQQQDEQQVAELLASLGGEFGEESIDVSGSPDEIPPSGVKTEDDLGSAQAEANSTPRAMASEDPLQTEGSVQPDPAEAASEQVASGHMPAQDQGLGQTNSDERAYRTQQSDVDENHAAQPQLDDAEQERLQADDLQDQEKLAEQEQSDSQRAEQQLESQITQSRDDDARAQERQYDVQQQESQQQSEQQSEQQEESQQEEIQQADQQQEEQQAEQQQEEVQQEAQQQDVQEQEGGQQETQADDQQQDEGQAEDQLAEQQQADQQQAEQQAEDQQSEDQALEQQQAEEQQQQEEQESQEQQAEQQQQDEQQTAQMQQEQEEQEYEQSMAQQAEANELEDENLAYDSG
jgi:hypothetical protein